MASTTSCQQLVVVRWRRVSSKASTLVSRLLRFLQSVTGSVDTLQWFWACLLTKMSDLSGMTVGIACGGEVVLLWRTVVVAIVTDWEFAQQVPTAVYPQMLSSNYSYGRSGYNIASPTLMAWPSTVHHSVVSPEASLSQTSLPAQAFHSPTVGIPSNAANPAPGPGGAEATAWETQQTQFVTA
ncbi:hypothetical protein QBC40DRAFT_298551 [Triangularia verruculosa]|uniref:Uncharacterized protein n=1 Tax=Triangularia verruculosa TaxID=2587418 RepID=A0AAN6XF56_9PEZI|nr:hypothetical protein QBC40DRAFT_298551 [Triangularia verruculosa]